MNSWKQERCNVQIGQIVSPGGAQEASLQKLLFPSNYTKLQKKSYRSSSIYFKGQIKMFSYFQKWDIDRGRTAFRWLQWNTSYVENTHTEMKHKLCKDKVKAHIQFHWYKNPVKSTINILTLRILVYFTLWIYLSMYFCNRNYDLRLCSLLVNSN